MSKRSDGKKVRRREARKLLKLIGANYIVHGHSYFVTMKRRGPIDHLWSSDWRFGTNWMGPDTVQYWPGTLRVEVQGKKVAQLEPMEFIQWLGEQNYV